MGSKILSSHLVVLITCFLVICETNNQELDQNKKPRFANCTSYTPQVKEEEPKGTYVAQVHAYDDDPIDNGGKVVYSLVRREGERQYFEIDPNSGKITTLMPFDRDEPVRQKELYLTIQATDNGRPQLADICTIKVTITDVNDNPPSFDSSSYTPNVAEDTRPNAIVAKIFAYDIDDGDNSKLTYSISDDNGKFSQYFSIDAGTGVLRLIQPLNGQKDSQFAATVVVADNGKPQHKTEAPITIRIVGSDKQTPNIYQDETQTYLPENFVDYEKPIFTIQAQSNMEDEQVVFELIKGKTAQTNKDQTFILKPQTDNTAIITLARTLDYEQVMEYTLTVRVKNKELMETSAKYTIKVEDVNDEIPTFIDIIKGSVIENELAGQKAMKVTALDKDGTEANNIVKYELMDNKDKFKIDENTGEITSLIEFDREEVPIYQIKIKAYDNSPSALGKNEQNLPNIVYQQFQITIEDRNDNRPKFTQPNYVFDDISETSDIGKDVGEVKAEDKDTASYITYSILDGDNDHHFSIENMTGRIKVNKRLNFEEIEQYTLTVKADDGIYHDTAKVNIRISNVNDKVPQFYDFNRTLEFEEEKLIENCIVNVRAYDPDIKDRNADQHILYSVDSRKKDLIEIERDGCVKLKVPLDRDKPNGSITQQIFIYADDNDGKPPSQKNGTEITIILTDINDNAPFLNVTEIVWYENEMPGIITTLSADDYDSIDNGPPFTFALGSEASEDIRNKFAIDGDSMLRALVQFDREAQKYYDIPITITDSGNPPLTSYNNILRVIIGDKNDNAAKDGESSIFVYKYEKLMSEIPIGRVYVEDPDDWDLNDKVFVKLRGDGAFTLNPSDNGMITMQSTVEPGSYELSFEVTETHLPEIETHTVNAVVRVEVKEIPEEAVTKSGSIRIKGVTAGDFIDKTGGNSKKDLLQFEVARILNTSRANVDVFTVIPGNDGSVDVRFSAHGSPYYYPEKLNNIATANQGTLQNNLNVEIVMIGINECLNASVCENQDCTNILKVSNEPANVFTNKTSFVGVQAVATASCNICEKPKLVNICLNNGTIVEDYICKCPAGFEGPHCEILGIGFKGSGSATYPPFDSCNNSNIQLSITTQTDNGLVFYLGPLAASQTVISKDYMSLEVTNGYPHFKYYVGDRLTEVTANKSINDGATHFIEIQYSTEDIRMEVDNCKSKCLGWTGLTTKKLVRTNGPLQIGGLMYKFQEESKSIWGGSGPIMNDKFSGCIRNFTHNGYFYNLGAPSDSRFATPDCAYAVAQAVTLGRDSLLAILVCLAVLIILMLALVVYRRKQDNLQEKETDDIRENIINYEEEGGGECDINFDINVLRDIGLEDKPKNDSEVPDDINMFLNTKKDNCDRDPDSIPYDDVRYYAYEGDGNSTGSLSSLASCTDDGDLNFSHISRFGPRFRRLADIYGEDEDDEESESGNEESWC